MSDDKPDAEATLHREVLKRFRAGASIETAHKEGGSRIYFRKGVFIHEEYGDRESHREFLSEQEFLDHLLEVRDWKLSAVHGSPRLSDLEAWQAIVDQLANSRASRVFQSRSTAAQSQAARAYFKHSRLRMWFAIVVGTLVLSGALVWKALAPLVVIRTTGSPLGEAVGSPAFVAQLISRQQPYVPSLNRHPDHDRFDVALLIHPRDSTAKAARLDLAEGYTASESMNAARLLGFDGTLL